MNRLHLPRLLVLCAVGLLPLTSRAARAAAPDDSAIAPYFDEGTFLVARVDLERVDQEAFGTYMDAAIDVMLQSADIPADFKPQITAAAKQGIASAKTWMTNMSEAGGKHVYLLMDSADLDNDEADGPVVIVPVAEGVDAEKVREQFAEGTGSGQEAVQIGKGIVFAPSAAIDRLQKRVEPDAKPVARPDLKAAFEAAGDVPLRFALVPGEASRAWAEKKHEKLPEQLGGVETKALSRGVRWASLGISQKPAANAQLTVRALDAEKAKTIHELMNKGLAIAKKDTEGKPEREDSAKLLAKVEPKLKGDMITASVDPMLLFTTVRDYQSRVEAEVEVEADAETKTEEKKKDDGGL